MSQIARELKQARPFRSAGQEAVVSIARTAALLELMAADALRPHGLTPTQFNVLRILRGAGEEGLPRCEVQERLIFPVADTTRLLDRLEGMGLVARTRNTDDRRVVTSRLTPKGTALVEKASVAIRQFEDEELGKVSEARLRSLISVLDEIRRRPPVRGE